MHSKKKLISLVTVSFLLISCTSSTPAAEKAVMDIGSFRIKTPKSWKHIKGTPIDSCAGMIAIDSTDTLHFNLGWYSTDKVIEDEPFIVERSLAHHLQHSREIADMIIVEDGQVFDFAHYRNSIVTWDSIDGRKAKIVSPRIPGHGSTGVYISHTFEMKGIMNKFNLYGKDLKVENETAVLEAIKTLTFRK